MKAMKQLKLWALAAILILCGTVSFASCTSNDDNPSAVQPTIQPIIGINELRPERLRPLLLSKAQQKRAAKELVRGKDKKNNSTFQIFELEI